MGRRWDANPNHNGTRGLYLDGYGAVFTTEVSTNSKILEAGSAGTSVFHYSGADKAVDTYLALADEVLGRA